MSSWSRWRADVTRPEVPTGRDELAFLTGSAIVIITIAQLTDPGSLAELLGLSPALAAFVLRGLVSRLASEAFAAATIVPVVLVVGNEGHLEFAFFLTVMAVLYSSWHLESVTRSLGVLAASAAAPWVVTHWLVPDDGIGWTAWSSASAFTFFLGNSLRKQQLLIEDLRNAREALAEQAVAEERRRIARELHDLAGHTLAAVLLHVTGARHVLRRDIDEAERALVDAETVGRASLDQIRATVAALRTDERGTDPALAGSADLGALAEEYRRAGLAVTTAIEPVVADLGGPVGTALHRIARESLANVARHAPGNRVELQVGRDGDRVRLVVADHGTPAPAAVTGSGHFGIVGMQERARALGGELEAGPTGDGWRVDAQLPVGTTHREEVVRS